MSSSPYEIEHNARLIQNYYRERRVNTVHDGYNEENSGEKDNVKEVKPFVHISPEMQAILNNRKNRSK